MIILIDCNNLGHRAWHTTGGLSYGGDPTGVAYGVIQQLFTVFRHCGPGEPVFCWDSPQNYRKEEYPEYKQRRKPATAKEVDTRAALFGQFESLKNEILPALGWGKRVYIRPGFEADDLIAWGAQTANECCTIVSGDEDLYQLLSSRVKIFKPGKNRFYNAGDFIADYGIPPSKWAEVKAIAGCSTDNVKGAVGVGEKTAIKYLLGKVRPGTRAWLSIEDAKKKGIIERNTRLVKLPYGRKCWEDMAIKLKPAPLKKQRFVEVFESYGMHSLTKRLGELSAILPME